MNRTELEYARRLLGRITSEKVQAFKPELLPTRELTPKQLFAGIKSGKIKLRKDTFVKNVTSGTAVDSLISSDSLGERPRHDTIKHRKAIDAIYAQADIIERKLFLGDNAQALALLEAFEKTK